MSKVFGSKKPKPPPIPKPVVLPQPDEEALAKARRRQQAANSRRYGRQSTIMTSAGGTSTNESGLGRKAGQTLG